jgi:hypothetical protein
MCEKLPAYLEASKLYQRKTCDKISARGKGVTEKDAWRSNVREDGNRYIGEDT